MADWTLKQLDRVVNSFLKECDSKMQGVLSSRLYRLSKEGNNAGYPLTKPIRDGLLELRGRSGRKRARLFFYFGPLKTIVFVHAIFKSSPKTPVGDIETAMQRMKAIQEGRKGKINGLDYIN